MYASDIAISTIAHLNTQTSQPSPEASHASTSATSDMARISVGTRDCNDTAPDKGISKAAVQKMNPSSLPANKVPRRTGTASTKGHFSAKKHLVQTPSSHHQDQQQPGKTLSRQPQYPTPPRTKIPAARKQPHGFPRFLDTASSDHGEGCIHNKVVTAEHEG